MRTLARSRWGAAAGLIGCAFLVIGCGDTSGGDGDELTQMSAEEPEDDEASSRPGASANDGAGEEPSEAASENDADSAEAEASEQPTRPGAGSGTASDLEDDAQPPPRDDSDPAAEVGDERPPRDDEVPEEATSSEEPSLGSPPIDDPPATGIDNPLLEPSAGPPAGNPEGSCQVPSEAHLVDTSDPDRIVGDGTKESCTADAVIDAVALGGIITFDCGPDPVTITLDRPAQIYNDAAEEVVIDGGGLVTLSGGGTTRILYMNTCDESLHFSTSHCDNQDHPRLTVQNITFADGSFKEPIAEEGGGGAIYALGGRLKIVNSRFFNNECTEQGADVAGAAVVAYLQHDEQPAYVVNSTFGGAEGYGNRCSNGGAIGSIGVSWTIINSVLSHNQAVGHGGNPPQDGTPGGGSGGAIYNDGGTMTLSLCGSRIEHNQVQEFGDAIFFVSNSHTGTLQVRDSVIQNNDGGEWHVLPGISMHDDTVQLIENSVIED